MAWAFRAYLRGFAAELRVVAAKTPLVSLVDLPTGHDVHTEAPDEVAGWYRTGWLRAASGPA